jgi:hypothetical protein
MPWPSQGDTTERNRSVVELWSKGVTSTKIAEISGLTRSAVMGIVYRARRSAELPQHRPGSPQERTAAEAAMRRSMLQPSAPVALRRMPEIEFNEATKRKPLFHAPIVEIEADMPEPIKDEAPIEGVSILKIRDGQCRWPVGRDSVNLVSFCGADTCQPRSSYCDAHHKISYVPAHKREREIQNLDYRPKPKFSAIRL